MQVITVFRNGDKHHEGVRMTVHPTKFKTYAQLMEAMTKQVRSLSPPPSSSLSFLPLSLPSSHPVRLFPLAHSPPSTSPSTYWQLNHLTLLLSSFFYLSSPLSPLSLSLFLPLSLSPSLPLPLFLPLLLPL